jgi:guanine deaminase
MSRPEANAVVSAAEPIFDPDVRFLTEACSLAAASGQAGGGPFGAVVVLGDRVVGRGANKVVVASDPTAHAELIALRAAATALGTHDLSGAVLYASCQPCPMCLAAAWWARVERVVHAATAAQASAAGFDDLRFWVAMADPAAGPCPLEHLPLPGAEDPLRAWAADPSRRPY